MLSRKNVGRARVGVSKVIFINDRNCVALQVKDYYQEKGLVTDNLYDAKVLLTWSDIPATENKQVQIAKELGIKTIMIAHGRNCSTNYDENYQDIITGQTTYPMLADKFLVWGQKDKDRLSKYGDKVKVVGCPLLLYPMPLKQEPKAIVFITHHDHSRSDARKVNEDIHEILLNKYGKSKFIYKHEDTLKAVPKYTMIVSPQMDNEAIVEEIKGLSYGIIRIDSCERDAWVKAMSLLIRAKVVISPTGGSFEGLAMAMNVPVIRVKSDFGYRNADGSDYIDDTKGVEHATIETLIDTIEHVDEYENREARKEVAIQEMGLGLDTHKLIIEEINKCL